MLLATTHLPRQMIRRKTHLLVGWNYLAGKILFCLDDPLGRISPTKMWEVELNMSIWAGAWPLLCACGTWYPLDAEWRFVTCGWVVWDALETPSRLFDMSANTLLVASRFSSTSLRKESSMILNLSIKSPCNRCNSSYIVPRVASRWTICSLELAMTSFIVRATTSPSFCTFFGFLGAMVTF